MFPRCPEIKKTTDYSRFTRLDWNRSIDATNFNRLLKENEKEFQLHKFPIIVTPSFEIIDGQHRYEVSKRIGSPVYYIVDESDGSFESVLSVNKAGKKHTLKDKIEMLYRAGDQTALTVYKVYNFFDNKFDIGTVARVICEGGSSGNINETIDKHHTIFLNNFEMGEEVLISLYSSRLPGKYSARIVFAFLSIVKESGLHAGQVMDRIDANLIKWIEPKSTQEAKRVMLNCYNYGLSEKSRIRIKGV